MDSELKQLFLGCEPRCLIFVGCWVDKKTYNLPVKIGRPSLKNHVLSKNKHFVPTKKATKIIIPLDFSAPRKFHRIITIPKLML